MIRTKGESGTRNIVEAIRYMGIVMGKIRTIHEMEEELWKYARNIQAPKYNYDKFEVSKGLCEAMKGLEMLTLTDADRMHDRGI